MPLVFLPRRLLFIFFGFSPDLSFLYPKRMLLSFIEFGSLLRSFIMDFYALTFSYTQQGYMLCAVVAWAWSLSCHGCGDNNDDDDDDDDKRLSTVSQQAACSVQQYGHQCEVSSYNMLLRWSWLQQSCLTFTLNWSTSVPFCLISSISNNFFPLPTCNLKSHCDS